MIRCILPLLALTLIGCVQKHRLNYGWHLSGSQNMTQRIEQALESGPQNPHYHIHLEEQFTIKRQDPLGIKPLHTAYLLTDRIMLSWDPVPKGRGKTATFEQDLILDIPQTQSIQTTPQVRHGKARLRQQLADAIIAYLH